VSDVSIQHWRCNCCTYTGETQEAGSTEASEWSDVNNRGGVRIEDDGCRRRTAWRCNAGTYWQVLPLLL